jgi:hypothetical protein
VGALQQQAIAVRSFFDRKVLSFRQGGVSSVLKRRPDFSSMASASAQAFTG